LKGGFIEMCFLKKQGNCNNNHCPIEGCDEEKFFLSTIIYFSPTEKTIYCQNDFRKSRVCKSLNHILNHYFSQNNDQQCLLIKIYKNLLGLENNLKVISS